MTGSPVRAALVALLAMAPGCGPLPRPPELTTLEKLRREAMVTALRAKNDPQVEKGDAAYGRAVAAWRDDDLRAARHHALLGKTRLRMAAAVAEEKRLRGGIATLRDKLRARQARESEARKRLAEIEEMVQLYEELAVAQSSALEKKLHVSEVRQAAEAEAELGRATLALKMAELVGAPKYAGSLLAMARVLAERARKELESAGSARAFATARLAAQKARQAHDAARPRYLMEQAAEKRHAQNQALQQELVLLASSSRRVSVKVVARGTAQQLVVTVKSLFPPLGSRPIAARRKLLDRLVEPLKRFADFHVVIRGHTSHRAPAARRLKLSTKRARRVADHFIAAGLAAGRFLVRGEGGARPVARKRSPVNDRVEICILLR